MRITPDGGATWWEGNERPPYLPGPEELADIPSVVVSAGGPSSAASASAWDRGGSLLGGRPDWIGDAEHPSCGACGEPMDYVALINGTDVMDYDGAHYLHIHAPCGQTAVTYQQS